MSPVQWEGVGKSLGVENTGKLETIIQKQQTLNSLEKQNVKNKNRGHVTSGMRDSKNQVCREERLWLVHMGMGGATLQVSRIFTSNRGHCPMHGAIRSSEELCHL